MCIQEKPLGWVVAVVFAKILAPFLYVPTSVNASFV